MKEEGFPIGSCLKTPVLFLVFNRPDTTRRVFGAIREAKPERLFVAADGPREGVGEDLEKCRDVRQIATSVDWDCEVSTLFRERNLGCKIAVSSAIDWVFEQVEEAIILEDDCLPDPTFFFFCEELLKRYQEDERVMHISGDNFLQRSIKGAHSYYFSRYTHIWGWATWRRAWRYYDVTMAEWKQPRRRPAYLSRFEDREEREFWRYVWDSVSNGTLDTWDYQWAFACFRKEGLAVIPSVNLISNIGFGSTSTHTRKRSMVANLPLGRMVFPMNHPHPARFKRDVSADELTRQIFFRRAGLIRRAVAEIRGIIQGLVLQIVDRVRGCQ